MEYFQPITQLLELGTQPSSRSKVFGTQPSCNLPLGTLLFHMQQRTLPSLGTQLEHNNYLLSRMVSRKLLLLGSILLLDMLSLHTRSLGSTP
jgi:hypothetical protein